MECWCIIIYVYTIFSHYLHQPRVSGLVVKKTKLINLSRKFSSFLKAKNLHSVPTNTSVENIDAHAVCLGIQNISLVLNSMHAALVTCFLDGLKNFGTENRVSSSSFSSFFLQPVKTSSARDKIHTNSRDMLFRWSSNFTITIVVDCLNNVRRHFLFLSNNTHVMWPRW